MKAFIVLILSSLIFTACATVDERPLTLDDEPGVASYPIKKSSSSVRVSKSNIKPAKNASAKVEEAEEVALSTGSSIQVKAEDVAIANRMMTAMDAYVFKNQKDDFTKLCRDKRFDCQVNDKKFPSGKRSAKRKVPPYMSGSKMGLQASEHVQVRYDFYP